MPHILKENAHTSQPVVTAAGINKCKPLMLLTRQLCTHRPLSIGDLAMNRQWDIPAKSNGDGHTRGCRK